MKAFKNVLAVIFDELTGRYFFHVISGYLLVQLLYAIFGQISFQSDSLRYYQQALQCIQKGTIYPGKHNLFDTYVNAPIYVNFLIIVLSLVKSQSIIPFINILINTANIYLIYKICLRLYGKIEIARTACIVYVFYLTNLGAILLNLTELFFVFLTLLAILNYFGNRNLHFALSGLFIFLAMGVRQFGVLLLISFAIYFVFILKNKRIEKNETKRILIISVSFFVFTFSYALLNKINSGVFLITGTTGSINVLMGANDKATGTYNNNFLLKEELGYLEDEEELTYNEKSDIWRDRAINWVRQNPIEWVLLFPRKIFHLFAYDDWSINALLNTRKWNLPKLAKELLVNELKEIKQSKNSTLYLVTFFAVYISHHIYYYCLLLLILFYLSNCIKNRSSICINRTFPLLIYAFLGSAITLLAVGVSRYKYPYLVILFIIITPYISNLFIDDKKYETQI